MTDAYLNIGRMNIEVRRVGLTGRLGLGTHQISLALDLTPIEEDAFASTVLVLSGEFEIQVGQGMPLPVTQLLPAYTVMFPSRTQGRVRATTDVRAHVPPDQLDAIERARDGAPLAINLKIQGVLFRAEGHLETPQEPKRHGFTADLLFRIKPAEWVEVLEQLHYSEGFLLQVPRFESRTSPKALAASAELRGAIKDITEGRFRHAVETCRNALEIAYSDDPQPEGLEYRVENLRMAGKNERFWLARQGLWAITNAAKHQDAVAQAIEWERSDAVAAVTMVASMLQRDPPL